MRAPLTAVAVAAIVGAGCTLPLQAGGTTAAVPGYRVVRDVQLPGDRSRFDYQVLDAASHRLYIAHLGSSQVVVFDAQANRVVAVIAGIEEVHGLALAPDLHRLFASATGKNQVAAIDTDSLQVVGRADAGDYPDGLAYVAAEHKLFVSDEHGTGDTVIDARTLKRTGAVKLGGGIGNSQYDAVTDRVYVAVGSDSTVAAIDPATDAVTARFKLPNCSNAHGEQVGSSGRVYVACDGNAVLEILDLATGRTGPTLSTGDGPDVLALDRGRNRLYVAAESGQLAVYDTLAPGLKKLGQGKAGPNAHTVTVDPASHLVYLPLTDVGGHPVLREMTQA